MGLIINWRCPGNSTISPQPNIIDCGPSEADWPFLHANRSRTGGPSLSVNSGHKTKHNNRWTTRHSTDHYPQFIICASRQTETLSDQWPVDGRRWAEHPNMLPVSLLLCGGQGLWEWHSWLEIRKTKKNTFESVDQEVHGWTMGHAHGDRVTNLQVDMSRLPWI